MAHYFGIRHLYLRVAGKKTLMLGKAVLQGPFESTMHASLARFNAGRDWDAVCGPLFESDSADNALVLSEQNTPKNAHRYPGIVPANHRVRDSDL